MRIEKINDNKIKVIFMRDDIKEWNINVKNLTDNTPEMQEVVWSVLRRAEREVGFSINGAQLQVEAIPSGGEELIMLITRIMPDSDAAMRNRAKPAAEVRQRRRIKRGSPVYIFRFKEFDDAVSGAKAVSTLFAGKSSLYKYEEKFYITIVPLNEATFFEASNILSEYAEKTVSSSLVEGRLGEYGKKMIEEGAIEILAQQF